MEEYIDYWHKYDLYYTLEKTGVKGGACNLLNPTYTDF